jgi:hypothetical protein
MDIGGCFYTLPGHSIYQGIAGALGAEASEEFWRRAYDHHCLRGLAQRHVSIQHEASSVTKPTVYSTFISVDANGLIDEIHFCCSEVVAKTQRAVSLRAA